MAQALLLMLSHAPAVVQHLLLLSNCLQLTRWELLHRGGIPCAPSDIQLCARRPQHFHLP